MPSNLKLLDFLFIPQTAWSRTSLKKDARKSSNYRGEANAMLRKGRLKEALGLYNEAAIWAPCKAWDSPELAAA